MSETSPKYLFPVQVMSKLLRGKMIAALRRLHSRGVFARFDDFDDPEAFERLMTRLARCRWHVYVKKPFREALHVLRYLGRYTHRVAISSSRLVEVGDDRVTFRTKAGKTVTLSPVEFLRRFVQHVLPDGSHKIRHYGIYAGSAREEPSSLRAARAFEPSSLRAFEPSSLRRMKPPPQRAFPR